MLNSIEEFFSKSKGIIKKEMCSTIEKLAWATQKALDSFTTEDIKGYIRDTLRYINLSLQGQDL